MNVIVVGAGIAGIATAHALSLAGASVRVVEASSTVAQQASFGDGGLLLPAPLDLAYGPGAHPRDARAPGGLPWTRRRRAAERAAQLREHFSRLKPLIDRSRTLFDSLETLHSVEFEARQGRLYLFDSLREMEDAEPLLALLGEHGYSHRLIDREACATLEPTLQLTPAGTGGVLLSAESSGNCALLAKRLKPVLEGLGVQFVQARAVGLQSGPLGVTVALTGSAGNASESVSIEPFHRSAASAAETALKADAVVVAAGSGAPALLQSAGVRLRLETLAMHTLTAPLAHEEFAPCHTVVDTARGTSLVRFENRLRVFRAIPAPRPAAEEKSRQRMLDELSEVAHVRLPGAMRLAAANPWYGRRLVAADRLPVFGPLAKERIFVNLGHGANGWGLAFGCAASLADMMLQRVAPADAEWLGTFAPARVMRG